VIRALASDEGRRDRFLTGTDEHSVNIAAERPPSSVSRHESSSTRRWACSRRPRPHCSSARIGSFAPRIRSRPLGAGDGSPCLRQRRHLPRQVRGLVLPAEGFRQVRVVETAAGPNARTILRSLWNGSPSRTGSFVCPPTRIVSSAISRTIPIRQPDYRRNEMLGFIRSGLEDFSVSRSGATWASRSRSCPTVPAPSGGRNMGSAAGTIYVWYDALSTTSPAPASRRPDRLRPLVAG